MNFFSKIDTTVWKELYSFHKFNPEMEVIIYNYMENDGLSSQKFLIYMKTSSPALQGIDFSFIGTIDEEYIENGNLSKELFFIINGKAYLEGLIKSFKNFSFELEN